MPCRIAARGLRSRVARPRSSKAATARRIGAEDGAQELRAPRSREPADAEDLAFAHVEIDVVQHARRLRPRTDSATSPEAPLPLRVDVAERPADHHADQRVGGDLVDLPRADDRAVAQHGHAPADGEHLAQAVRDVDEGDAFRREPPDHVEELRQLRLAERGGRFVEDDDAGVARQRPGDLHHLPLRDVELHQPRAGIDAEAEPLHHRQAVSPQPAPVHHPESPDGQAAEEDVFRDGQVRRLHQFLIDDRDPQPDHAERGRMGDRLARDADLARIRLLRARQDLDERGLSRAVLADQRVDLACPHRRNRRRPAPSRRESDFAMPIISRRGGVGAAGWLPSSTVLAFNAYDLII